MQRRELMVRVFRDGLLMIMSSKVPVLTMDARTTVAKVERHVSGAALVLVL